MTVTAGPAAGVTLMGSGGGGGGQPFPVPMQALGLAPQAAQQQQQQPVRHALSQPGVMDRDHSAEMAPQQGGLAGSWQRAGAGGLQAAAAVQLSSSRPQQHNPFAEVN